MVLLICSAVVEIVFVVVVVVEAVVLVVVISISEGSKHSKVPSLLIHVVLFEQESDSIEHSSISIQLPAKFGRKPALHSHKLEVEEIHC